MSFLSSKKSVNTLQEDYCVCIRILLFSGGASLPLLVGHKCVTGGAQAIKLGHTYINEVGHRPHLAPPSRHLCYCSNTFGLGV